MKILILTSSYKMQLNFRKEFMQCLLGLGHHLDIFSDKLVEDKIFPSRKHNLKSFSSNLIFLIIDFFKIKKLVNLDNEVIFNYTVRNCLISSFLAILKLNKKKNIYFIAGLGRSFKNDSIKSHLILKIISEASKINKSQIVVMNTRDYQVFKLFGAKPIKINSEGLNLNGFKFSERIKLGNNFRIVFLGRIIEEKGIFDILKLADSFKSFKNVQIDIFGDLSETPLEFIKKAETLNNLKIFGFTRNPLNEIKNSDLIILPSKLNEGLPRIMLEAFSVGRICVSYNIPGCSDIYGFTDFKTDFLANSSQEFIQICKSVYFLSQENYSRIVKNLHCSVICNHDINTINNNLINQLKF